MQKWVYNFFSALHAKVTFDRLASAIIMQDRNYQYGWSSLIYAHYSRTDINRLQEALCSLAAIGEGDLQHQLQCRRHGY